LALVGKVRYRAASIKQLIDLREQQFVFLVFPLVISQVCGFWSLLELLSKLAYLRYSGRRNTPFQTRGDKNRMPLHIPMRQMPPSKNPVHFPPVGLASSQ
jgi:hypothetical protein